MKRPLITLLTDFGARDHYVAAMKGVILGICPEASVVDITHEIPPFQIVSGAYTLAQAATAFPPGTIHIAVVDPGVGGARRPLAARAARQFFVGPDNGLLDLALAAANRRTVYEITNRKLFRQPVSATFHGRDIFAPVAAHLAQGLAIAQIGSLLASWRGSPECRPVSSGLGRWTGRVLHIDRFGNIVTNFAASEFGDLAKRTFLLKVGKRKISRFASTYEAMGGSHLFAVCGSGGLLEVSINKGDAAKISGARIDDPIELSW